MSGLVAGEGAIGKYPEGRKALESLASAGLFFLQWRAYANYKKELKSIRNAIGVLFVISGFMLLIVGHTATASFYNALPGACLVVVCMLQFGLEFKKGVRQQLSIVGLFLLAPWAALVLDTITPQNASLLQTMAEPLTTLGINSAAGYKVALVLSLVGGLLALFMACLMIILFSILPLLLLFPIVLTSRLSQVAINIRAKNAYNIAIFYFFILGPLLIGLEAKGFI